MSFTPTHALETSQKYYEFDDKAIVSFDNKVQQNEEITPIDFKSAVRHSSPAKANIALDLYNEDNEFTNIIKKHKRKQSCLIFSQLKTKIKNYLCLMTNPVLKKKKTSALNELLTNEETKNEDFQKND